MLTLHEPGKSPVTMTLVDVPSFQFHAELAAYLTEGTPMRVTTRQSRDVVAVMQAAEESALANGRPVTPVLLRDRAS